MLTKTLRLTRAEREFPSPSGTIYSSIIRSEDLQEWFAAYGFRPLRGLSIPQSGRSQGKSKVLTGVSVPFGDYLFLNMEEYMREKRDAQFPSPSGTLYSSISFRRFLMANFNFVSVPFGDYLFLNINFDLNTLNSEFPSPSGTLYFSMQSLTTNTIERIGFRPLRGLSISQSVNKEIREDLITFPSPSGTIYSSIGRPGAVHHQYRVSVPFGDYLFLNTNTQISHRSTSCFRPLRGLSIPQC